MVAEHDDELRVIQTLNRLLADGKIKDYALFGASAMTYWTEPIATVDLDYVIAVDSDHEYRTAVFSSIGPESDGSDGGFGLVFGDTPVQFFPSTTLPLYADALENAEQKNVPLPGGDTITTRVIRPEHLVLFALEAWRSKDKLRIQMLLEVTDEQETWRLIKEFDGPDARYEKRYRSIAAKS